MSRRCSSPQALDAYVFIKNCLNADNYCIKNTDNEIETLRKLNLRKEIDKQLGIIESFIANPHHTQIRSTL